MRIQRLFSTLDAHAGGQPLRIVTSGLPPLAGKTLLEQRATFAREHDHIRTLLLHEPRGHSNMYGAIVLPPLAKNADYGVIFMTNEGYSSMCGHGIIALTTALIETGAFPDQGQETRITYDTPVGLVQARATVEQDRVRTVRFRNVPSFRLAQDLEIEFRGSTMVVDVAFGGAWYAVVSDHALGLKLGTSPVRDIIAAGMQVKRAVSNALDVVHPVEAHIAGLYGTIITGQPSSGDFTMRNATVYADGAIDRSPCGTGTSALVACLAADGELEIGDTLFNESLTGSVFTGRIVMPTTVGTYEGVVPEIAGNGALTGMHQFVLDHDDPFPGGFLIR
jgi:proline racemase